MISILHKITLSVPYMEQNMELPTELFLVTNCCAFCLEQFPLHRAPGPELWKSMVRAVSYPNLDDNSGMKLTRPFYLPDEGYKVNVTFSGHPQTQTTTISRKLEVSHTFRTDQRAFCFHSWCYSVLAGELVDCSVSVIYRLSRAIVPDPLIWEEIQERRHDPHQKRRLMLLACHEEQPLFMSRLPIELRIHVWRYTGLATPYSAFMLVKNETARLVGHLCSPLKHKIVPQGFHLSAKMVSIFGTEYIQDLIVGGDSKKTSGFTGDIIGVRYITSLHGLRAFQFLGTDWESDWIGKFPSVDCNWYGIIQGAVSALQYSFNDLNCTAMSFTEALSEKQVVWDQLDFPSNLADPDATLFYFERDIDHSVTKSAERLFFRYLPLHFKDEYTRGLSVYTSRYGIVGLEVHFTRSSRLSGSRSGCVLHFSLCEDERIAYVWVRVFSITFAEYAEPALAIETTRGRLHTFGPYIRPYEVTDNEFKWFLLPHEGCITGFYYENVTPSTPIMRFGVIGDNTTPRAQPLCPQYYDCEFPSLPIAAPNAGLFLSLAVLRGLKKVDMCRFEKRCAGLMIHYLDGRSSVLGQWHTYYASQSSCIYDGNGPAITNIYFEMSKYREHQIVTAISFTPLTAETTLDSECLVFSVGEHIAWWFSENYDEVLHWTGELQDIPEECEKELDA